MDGRLGLPGVFRIVAATLVCGGLSLILSFGYDFRSVVRQPFSIVIAANSSSAAVTKPTGSTTPASIRPIRTIRPVKTVAPLRRTEPIKVEPIRPISRISASQSAKLAKQMVESQMKEAQLAALQTVLNELDLPGSSNIPTIRLHSPHVHYLEPIKTPQVIVKAQLKPMTTVRVVATPKRKAVSTAIATAKPAAYQCVTQSNGTSCKGSPFTPKPSTSASSRWSITPDPIHGRVVTPTPTVLPDHLQKLVDLYLQAVNN